jgi:hypothetical protein
MTIQNQTFGDTNDDSGIEPVPFSDRRKAASRNSPGLERRQFSDSYSDLSPEAAELGKAIDQYKLVNRRRYITYEEMLGVIKSLGYNK